MSSVRFVRTALLGIALAAAPEAALHAQSGVVYGTVYDSIANEPLADAAVFLWDTPHQVVSDSEGRFRIPDVAAGEYSALFFHARLGEMAASPGPVALQIAAGDSVEVDLGTPSMFTIVSTQCLLEDVPQNSGALAGWVGDAATGMGLPGSHVFLNWQNGSGAVETAESTTDAAGWYRFCDAPTGMPLSASVRFLDRESMRREVVASENTPTQASFLVESLEPTRINGRLMDSQSLAPVANAEVWLRGTSVRGMSDDEGEFHFDDVRPGQYMLMTEHLAYGTKMDTLDVPPGERITVEMALDTRAIAIAPLTVTVDSRRVTERAMGGIQIPPAKVAAARQTARDAADILRAQHIPGVIIKRRIDGTMCVGYSSGQVRMLDNTSGSCIPMMVFINGARSSNSSLALQLPLDAIDRMVVYRPVEAGNLFGFGASNGVLMIYTKGN